MYKKKLGVAVVRLQSDDLHEGHRFLLDSIADASDHTLLCLGTNPEMDCKIPNNPLPFESRKMMVYEHYSPSKVTILAIRDVLGNDNQRSKNLDEIITNFAKDVYDPIELFGSRDSFIKVYNGIFHCSELEQYGDFSATGRRKEIAKEYPQNLDQRKGAIRSVQQNFPTVYSVVDVAVFNEDYSKIRLARKEFNDKYCFIGGFVDPEDKDRQHAAYRELEEETGINIDGINSLKHIGSAKVLDRRYVGTPHTVMSDLFYTQQQRGGRAQDDIIELVWKDYHTLSKEILIPAHYDLFELLISHIPQKK